MTLNEIKTRFPTHADDMPWTSGPKSEWYFLQISTSRAFRPYNMELAQRSEVVHFLTKRAEGRMEDCEKRVAMNVWVQACPCPYIFGSSAQPT